MPDFRPIFLVNGVLLTALGLAMLLPTMVDLAVGHPDWKVFATASSVTVFAGVSLVLTNWGYRGGLSVQQAFLLTTSAWVFSTAFAALPFVFSEFALSYTDAFFEAMSGLTTTGSTVLTGLDRHLPVSCSGDL